MKEKVDLGNIRGLYDAFSEVEDEKKILNGILAWVLMTFHRKRARSRMHIDIENYFLRLDDDSKVRLGAKRYRNRQAIRPDFKSVTRFLGVLIQTIKDDKFYTEKEEYNQLLVLENNMKIILALRNTDEYSAEFGEMNYVRDLTRFKKGDREYRVFLKIPVATEVRAYQEDSWVGYAYNYRESIEARVVAENKNEKREYSLEELFLQKEERYGIPDKIAIQYSYALNIEGNRISIDGLYELSQFRQFLRNKSMMLEKEIKIGLVDRFTNSTETEDKEIIKMKNEMMEMGVVSIKGREIWDRIIKHQITKFEEIQNNLKSYLAYSELIKAMGGSK